MDYRNPFKEIKWLYVKKRTDIYIYFFLEIYSENIILIYDHIYIIIEFFVLIYI